MDDSLGILPFIRCAGKSCGPASIVIKLSACSLSAIIVFQFLECYHLPHALY